MEKKNTHIYQLVQNGTTIYSIAFGEEKCNLNRHNATKVRSPRCFPCPLVEDGVYIQSGQIIARSLECIPFSHRSRMNYARNTLLFPEPAYSTLDC